MKQFKPTSPGRRQMSLVSHKNTLSGQKPLKSLTGGRHRPVGRSSSGRISVRHKGGGVKRLWREVDFVLEKKNIPARVEAIEYDPNRSGFIARICFVDGSRRYILAPTAVKLGDEILFSEKALLKPGNRLPLKNVSVGTLVYNVELVPGGGAKLGRSAGNFLEVLSHDLGRTTLKMPSGEIRMVPDLAWASVGLVSNPEHNLVVSGKAGRSRWLGIRPTVRGSVMNPVDHPYGGGEGRQGRGTRRAKTLWGKPSGKGQKTRYRKKYSRSFILPRRPVGKK